MVLMNCIERPRERLSLVIRQNQQSIREELRDCTTLTIAHGINNRIAFGIGDELGGGIRIINGVTVLPSTISYLSVTVI
ncbi:hypothetical protein F441_09409 [Phytophthora nicotianae CJ01A1]|uniref:Uncharacterized protein n=5 Tax=Phytophthora nicotianae TaxID=4792 RepID=W2Q6X7_PHYN3|nr:hypothetical protein PPTG_23051 [Phytophthora nicotianae INRA-310]ETI46135.1 hypothetical protein F443_09458 [Phytophthora nicotianae P1569]ETO74813.1 hypothetical protein F444_09534 [Phytophthora nicotianae P1976]ETP15945.1 hypothetical protein F441_09409 [Phytophthora nicotianae CJ01A1]ETP43999.1 hypothetical protein F442_09379 [Phytophthora nicotianae P10297]ETN08616.1 hypothetical protein PPTG_23051 [Phytophthora nicotianae INRA-310]